MTAEKKTIETAKSYASAQEIAAYDKMCRMLKECPIPNKEILANLGLFLNRASLSRIFFMQRIYRKIIHTPGVIMEFGVRWGQNVALFESFRTIYEPYNYTRKILGFDTFEGFPSVAPQDGDAEAASVGALSVTPGYKRYLSELLEAHEQLAPRPHIRKFELVQGDVVETLPKYLKEHPETIIALAYFDLDVYEPTKRCLQEIGNI